LKYHHIPSNKQSNMLIYKIITPHSKKCYVGKTTMTLGRRMWDHESHYRRWLQLKVGWCSSSGLLWLGDCTIVQLEDTDDKYAEARWIRKLDCVNDSRPPASVEETNEKAVSNREKIRQWYTDNIEHCTYYRANYYETKMKTKRAVKIPCDRCGFMGTTQHMKRHQATARCIRLSNAEGSTIL